MTFDLISDTIISDSRETIENVRLQIRLYCITERDIEQNANVTYASSTVQCTHWKMYIWKCEMIILTSQGANADLLSYLIFSDSPELLLRNPG